MLRKEEENCGVLLFIFISMLQAYSLLFIISKKSCSPASLFHTLTIFVKCGSSKVPHSDSQCTGHHLALPQLFPQSEKSGKLWIFHLPSLCPDSGWKDLSLFENKLQKNILLFYFSMDYFSLKLSSPTWNIRLVFQSPQK